MTSATPLSESHAVRTMSVADWIAVMDNPRQRDTERHAKRALDWLSTPSPAHLVVHAAEIVRTGKMIKLDGHTRAYLWSRRQIPVPTSVRVNIYRVRHEQEAAELYTHFDNIRVAESASDRAFGAMREVGFDARSGIIRRCKFGEALRWANAFAAGMARTDRQLREYELVREFRKELELLDTLDPNPQDFPGPLITAFVLTMRRRGGKAEEFWLKYKMQDAKRDGRERDAVQALLELMLQNRNSRAKLPFYDLCGRAISACEAYIRGDTFTGGLRVTAPERYLPITARNTRAA